MKKSKSPKEILGAVIYCRVSTAEQVEGFSLASQERICTSFCTQHGMPVVHVFIEEGKSARTTARNEFMRALAFCEKNRTSISHFVVYKYDRFARSSEDHHAMRGALRRYGIELLSVTEGALEVGSLPKFMEGIMACHAELESDLIGERARAGMLEARRSGRLSGPAPIGYRNIRPGMGPNRIEKDPTLAPLIELAFELFSKSEMTQAQIVKHINSLGYTSPKGSKLSTQQLGKMLRYRVYTGQVFVNDEEGWVNADFSPIIDFETFLAVQSRLDREVPSQAKPHTTDRPEYPLRRFIRCSGCGRPLTASHSRSKSKKQYAYYHCYRKECSSPVRIPCDQLEAAFVELLARLVPTPKFESFLLQAAQDAYSMKSEVVEKENNRIGVTLKKARARRQSLIEQKIDGRIQDEVYFEQYARLESQIADLESKQVDIAMSQAQLSRILNEAVFQMKSAANAWITAGLRARQKLQVALFPNGLTYDQVSGLGTPIVPQGFNYLELLESSNEEMAGGQGFEPR